MSFLSIRLVGLPTVSDEVCYRLRRSIFSPWTRRLTILCTSNGLGE